MDTGQRVVTQKRFTASVTRSVGSAVQRPVRGYRLVIATGHRRTAHTQPQAQQNGAPQRPAVCSSSLTRSALAYIEAGPAALLPTHIHSLPSPTSG